MATLQAPLRIYSWNLGGTPWYLQQKYIYHFNTGSGSPLYIHMKLSIQETYPMWLIEAVGYNYGLGASVRCAWGFHKSGAGLYSIGLQNAYGGLNADGIYLSSDGYPVIRAYAGSQYYQGFILNAYSTRGDAASSNISVIAASQNSTSGNYY